MDYAAHLNEVRQRMAAASARSGRSPEDTTLIAVSKGQSTSAIAAVAAAGQRLFGENYAQHLRQKQELFPQLEWHFIGHLQRNKAKMVVPCIAMFHALDTLDLAQTIHHKAELLGREPVATLVEVNLAGEASKRGVLPEDTQKLMEGASKLTGLHLMGLMAIPPYLEDPEAMRPHFQSLRELRDELAQRLGMVLPHLSMGMSNDFQIAIEEGSTLVRVGTAIFGERSMP